MCVVFTLYRSLFFLSNHISKPRFRADSSSQRDTNSVVSLKGRINQTGAIHQGKASEMLAYQEREHLCENTTKQGRA